MTTQLTKHSNGDFDLGAWLGRRQAFGLMAGRSLAAEAECLRRIREEKLYRSRAKTWSEFCANYLSVCKSQADRIIQQLNEFGPEYFTVAQLTKITPETFRAIREHLGPDGLRAGGEVIALLPENGERLTRAIAQLRPAADRKPPAPGESPFPALLRQCRELIARLDTYPAELTAHERCELSAYVQMLRDSAGRLAMV